MTKAVATTIANKEEGTGEGNTNNNNKNKGEPSCGSNSSSSSSNAVDHADVHYEAVEEDVVEEEEKEDSHRANVWIAGKASLEACGRLSLYVSLGFRFMFISIPFGMYAYGPEALLCTTVVFAAYWWHSDFR
jgi:hypothetical protein